MAKAISFDGANGIEDYPPDSPSRPLPVQRVGTDTISCWLLDDAELATIAHSRVVWVRTQTFSRLDEAPTGERWQTPLFVTGLNESLQDQALPVETERPEFVVLADRAAIIAEAKDALERLSYQLRTANDIGGLNADEAKAAAEEVSLLRKALDQRTIRVDWIIPLGSRSLRWIAEQVSSAAVKELAIEALRHLVRAFLG